MPHRGYFFKDVVYTLEGFMIKITSLFSILISCTLVCASLVSNSQDKNYPEILNKPIVEALSFYPDLENVSIDFIFKDKIKNAVMQAQPRVKTLFKNKEKRSYKIKISRFIRFGNVAIPIEKVPHDILVGWVAHELGHVMDYLDRSSFQMIGFGINYVCSKKFLREAEKRADQQAIFHGLADYIIKTKKYILNHKHLSDEYKAKIDEYYLSPSEVRSIESSLISADASN